MNLNYACVIQFIGRPFKYLTQRLKKFPPKSFIAPNVKYEVNAQGVGGAALNYRQKWSAFFFFVVKELKDMNLLPSKTIEKLLTFGKCLEVASHAGLQSSN